MSPVQKKPKQHPPMTPNRELTFLKNRKPNSDCHENLRKYVVWKESLLGVRRYVLQGQGLPTKLYCVKCGKNKCFCPLDE